MSLIVDNVAQFLQTHQLSDQQLLLGFSGGADSCALLLALQLLQLRKFQAIHFEHGIREQDSLNDAEWCQNFCRLRQIPCQIVPLQVPQNRLSRESLESAARRLRLQAWQQLCQDKNYPVLLAHQADDCQEDLLLRLGRGANCSGLTGLREMRRLGKLSLYRPLLKISRRQIEDFLLQQGVLDWCRDSSNEDISFRRNAVRHQLLPCYQSIFQGKAALTLALDNLRQDADFLEAAAAKQLEKLSSLASWRSLPPALLPRVLRLWLNRELQIDLPPNRQLLQRLQKELRQPDPISPRKIPLGGRSGKSILITADGLQCLSQTRLWKPRLWNWQQQAKLYIPELNSNLTATLIDQREIPAPDNCEFFHPAEMPELLQLRGWQAGDKMIPFGADYQVKLQDLFTNAHVAGERRQQHPLLLAHKQIIWCIGIRRAEFARTQKKQKCLKISWQKNLES